MHFLGIFTLMFGSFLFLYEKKSLDYLLIPTGWKWQRKKRALEELSKRNVKNVLILNGLDSEEDILYLGKRLKEKERVGFVTFPLHYDEYRDIIKKAQKERKFPKGVKTENISTEQTLKEFIYGILGLAEEKLNNRDIDYKKNKHENYLFDKLKKYLKKILK